MLGLQRRRNRKEEKEEEEDEEEGNGKEGHEEEEGAEPKLTPMQERMKERMGEKEFAAVRPNPLFRPSKLDRCLEAAKDLVSACWAHRCSSGWRRWRRPCSGGGSSCRR